MCVSEGLFALAWTLHKFSIKAKTFIIKITFMSTDITTIANSDKPIIIFMLVGMVNNHYMWYTKIVYYFV